MPLATMASAWARTVASSILAAKWFQLFQPIGGVGAVVGAACAEAPASMKAHMAAAADNFLPTEFTFALPVRVCFGDRLAQKTWACAIGVWRPDASNIQASA